MRKIFIYLFAAFVLSACDFLNVNNIGKSTIDNYYSEVDALPPAMNGIYNAAWSLYDTYFALYCESASDEVSFADNSSPWFRFHTFETTSADESTAVGYIWKYGYNVINNCNEVLYYAPILLKENPGDASSIRDMIGQAYFMRAMVHFDLCRVYGQNYSYKPDASHQGIAVADHIQSLTEKISRSSVRKVYAQVVSDLETSLEYFTAAPNDCYVANSLAAKALLARVYLYMGDNSKAVSYAGEVISARGLTPREKYASMYTSAGVAGEEAIFRLHGYGQSGAQRKYYYYESPVARPSAKLTSLFTDADDVRTDLFSYEKGGKCYPNVVMKYYCTDEDAADEQKFASPFLLRVSEQYLIRAEAACRLSDTSQAEKDLKALKARARGVSADAVSISWTGTDGLLSLIEEERMRELCFEGHRFFDLARWHKDVSNDEVNFTYPDYRYVLQIPYVELDANENIKNNPTSNQELE